MFDVKKDVPPRFRNYLESMGYEITQINVNFLVNGLFSNIHEAISLGVYGTTSKYDLVRTEIANYLSAHEDEFAYLTLDDGGRIRNPKVDYLFALGSWEMKKIIAAASLLYGFVMVIITEERLIHQFPESGGFDRVMTLAYQFRDHVDFLTQRPMKAQLDEPDHKE